MQGHPSLIPVRSPCDGFLAQSGDICIDSVPPLQSIIRPLSGQPGSLRLSDFSFYKQAGKQPPNFAIIMGVVSVSVLSLMTHSNIITLAFFSLCTIHSYKYAKYWVCYSGIVDHKAEQYLKS